MPAIAAQTRFPAHRACIVPYLRKRARARACVRVHAPVCACASVRAGAREHASAYATFSPVYLHWPVAALLFRLQHVAPAVYK